MTSPALIFPKQVTDGLSVLADMHQSGGSPVDLGVEQIKLLKHMFEDKSYGLFFFAVEIFGYKDLTFDLHLPICQYISKWGDPAPLGEETDYRRLMVRIPRDHFKTSVCTRANSLWVLARDPLHDDTIGIFNEIADNSESWVGAICEVVESSQLFQMIWSDMLPTGISIRDRQRGQGLKQRWKWGGTGIRFVRNSIGVSELSIEPHGIKGSATGKHFTKKILDDIIGKNASESVAEMQSAIHWVDNSRPLEKPANGGCELVCHTPWAYADVYAHMLRKWPTDYRVLTRHLLEDENGRPDVLNGKSIFEAKISTKKAKQMAKTDSFHFNSQFQCIPRAGKDLAFSEDWMRLGKIVYTGTEPVFRINDDHYDPEILDLESEMDEAPQYIPLNWMHKAVILDPIPGKPSELKQEPNCHHGLIVVGKDPWGRRFCLESARYRMPPTEVFHKVMELYQKWACSLVAIEEVNFSYVFQPLFQLLAQAHYEIVPDIIPTSTKGRQKLERIRQNLQSPHENGFFYYNEKGTSEIIQEITEFPHCETLDVIDAQSYTDEVLQRPETPNQFYQSWYEEKSSDQERGPCGYGVFV